MFAGEVQEGENVGGRIHRLPHYYLRIYIITDDPNNGLLLLISPWSGENSHGLYFFLL